MLSISSLIIGFLIGAFVVYWLAAAVRELERLAEKAERDRWS
jgi:hypothetical protein